MNDCGDDLNSRLFATGVLLLLLMLTAACRQESGPARLLIGGPGDQRSPAWMPDGKGIVYSSSSASPTLQSGKAEGLPADLYLFDLETRTSRRLTTEPSGENNPAVSPDGRLVVFQSDHSGGGDLYCLDLVTSTVFALTTGPARDGFAAWSPDGQQIVFHSEGAGDPDLWLMDRDGKQKIPLVYRPGVDSTPAWSPDGRAIAFSGEAGGNPDIWLVRLEDRRLVRLTDSGEAEWKPTWSPDGERIAYCRGPTSQGHSNLWIMNADGTQQRPLTARSQWDDYDPAWSPDGRWVAFESNRNGDFDIWILNAER